MTPAGVSLRLLWLLAVVALHSNAVPTATGPADSLAPAQAPPHCRCNATQRILPPPVRPTRYIFNDEDRGFSHMRDVVFPPDIPVPLYISRMPADSALECNKLCLASKNVTWREYNVPVNCTLWQFCQDPGGCPSVIPALDPHTCELQSLHGMDQGCAQSPFKALDAVKPIIAKNVLLGAPIQYSQAQSPMLGGYARYPSLAYEHIFNFPCPASMSTDAHNLTVNPSNYSCWVNGTLPDIAAACDSIPGCDLFVYFPLGKAQNKPDFSCDARWGTSAVLKATRKSSDPSKLFSGSLFDVDPNLLSPCKAYNPLAVTYIKYNTLLLQAQRLHLLPSDLTNTQRAVIMEVHGLSPHADNSEAKAAGEYLRQSIREVLGLDNSSVVLRQAVLSQAFVQPAQALPPSEAPMVSAALPLSARRGLLALLDAPADSPEAAPAASAAAAPVAALTPLTPPPVARPSSSGYVNSSLAVLNMTFASASEAAKGKDALQKAGPDLLAAFNKRSTALPAREVKLLHVTGPGVLPVTLSGGSSTHIVAAAVGGSLAALAVFGLAIAGLLLRRRRACTHSINKALVGPDAGKGSSGDTGSKSTASTASTMCLESLGPHVVKAADLVTDKDEHGRNKLLGEGSFGKVYLATWCQTKVAVKHLATHEDHAVKDFLNEIKVLSDCRHDNIVTFYSACTGPDGYMLVYEFMAGGDLGTALAHDQAEPRRFGWYNCGLKVLLGIARGLAYLHSRRVIHFDIKPNNILLDSWNLNATAKVADVGLARIIHATFASMTDGSYMRGCMAYMAPELRGYDDNVRLSAAVDMFSFGILAWEVMTGERASWHHARREFKVPEELPEAGATLLMQLRNHDPRERPSAVDVVTCLEALQRGSKPRNAPVALPDAPPST